MADHDEFLRDQVTGQAELQRAKLRARELEAQLRAAQQQILLERARADLALAISGPRDPQPIEHRKAGKRVATPIAVASDWHIGEDIDPASINGLNEFDNEIAARRVQRFFRSVAWLVDWCRSPGTGKSGYSIEEMVLALLGDLIAGYLRDEDLQSNLLSPTQSIDILIDWCIAGVDYLLKRTGVKRLLIPCACGNHDRTTRKRQSKRSVENSYAWLLYRQLARHYAKDPRVEVYIAGGAMIYFDVYRWKVRAMHGDNLKFQGGIGGVSIPLRRAVDAWNKGQHADYTICGHWHQLQDFGDIVVNGSLCGYGPYARDEVKARFEPPRQAFFLIDQKRGKTVSCPIWVDA